MEGGAKGKEKKKPLDVFNDFKARHAGLLKALTTGFLLFLSFVFLCLFLFFFNLFDRFGVFCMIYLMDLICSFGNSDVEEFFKLCDPGKELFFICCLYELHSFMFSFYLFDITDCGYGFLFEFWDVRGMRRKFCFCNIFYGCYMLMYEIERLFLIEVQIKKKSRYMQM